VWSPDGKYLLYNAMKDGAWNIKYIDRENGQASFITSHPGNNFGYFSPQWGPDSKKIIVQDMGGVYIMDLHGNILRTIEINNMDTTVLASSSTQFLLAGKEDKLIFDCQVSTDTAANSEGEPLPHLFSYDLNTKKLTRLEPKDYVCYAPVLKGDTIYCTGYKRTGNDDLNIYSMDLSGDHFKVAFKHYQDLSCRTLP
jgi:hypothetical protein